MSNQTVVLAPFESAHQDGPRQPGGEVGGAADESRPGRQEGDGDGSPTEAVR